MFSCEELPTDQWNPKFCRFSYLPYIILFAKLFQMLSRIMLFFFTYYSLVSVPVNRLSHKIWCKYETACHTCMHGIYIFMDILEKKHSTKNHLYESIFAASAYLRIVSQYLAWLGSLSTSLYHAYNVVTRWFINNWCMMIPNVYLDDSGFVSCSIWWR